MAASDKPNIAYNPSPYAVSTRWSKRFILSTLLQGLMVTLPLVIILIVLSLLMKFVGNILEPINVILAPGSEEPHWAISFLSMLLLALVFFGVGLAFRHKNGKSWINHIEEEYLCQIPLYRTVREIVKQFAGLKSMPFQQVVLVDPYNTGIKMTGFVTEELGNDMYTIFVPTAPNPTNGNIYHVPADRLVFLDVKPEDGMRTIVGVGTGSSCLFAEKPVPHIDPPATPLHPQKLTA